MDVFDPSTAPGVCTPSWGGLSAREGIDLLHRLNGQFAFVICDRKERRLFVARDHFGISNAPSTGLNEGLYSWKSEFGAGSALHEHYELRLDG